MKASVRGQSTFPQNSLIAIHDYLFQLPKQIIAKQLTICQA